MIAPRVNTGREEDSSTQPSQDDAYHSKTSKTNAGLRPITQTGRKPKVSWTLVNFWLDTTMLVVFLALVWVSTVIRFVFPAASVASGWSLWGGGIDAWMTAQFALVSLLSFAILVHLMLHWSWVCGVFFGRLLPRARDGKPRLPDDGIRTIYGVGLMILLLNVLGLLLAAAAICVDAP